MIACPREPAYGAPSTTRHMLAPVPTIDEQERRAPGPGAECRLGDRRRAHVGLEDDPRRGDRDGQIEVAPVDRVGARRPAVEADELAQPDPDGQRAPAERLRRARRSRRAPPRRRAPAASAADPLAGPARSHVDDTGRDLRSADVDPDGEAHARRRRLAFLIAL